LGIVEITVPECEEGNVVELKISFAVSTVGSADPPPNSFPVVNTTRLLAVSTTDTADTLPLMHGALRMF
jgi:hypothetical protein